MARFHNEVRAVGCANRKLTTLSEDTPCVMVREKRHNKGGEELLKMDQYEFIRTAHRVYGKNISELSRMTGHSRNTIKKAIRGEPWGYHERERQPFPVLESYLAIIDSWLLDDKDRPNPNS